MVLLKSKAFYHRFTDRLSSFCRVKLKKVLLNKTRPAMSSTSKSDHFLCDLRQIILKQVDLLSLTELAFRFF